MAAQVKCPFCQAILRLPDPLPQAVRCSGCQKAFRLGPAKTQTSPNVSPPAPQPPLDRPRPVAGGHSNPFATAGSGRQPASWGSVRRKKAPNQLWLWGLLGLSAVVLTGGALTAWWMAKSRAATAEPAFEFKPPPGGGMARFDEGNNRRPPPAPVAAVKAPPPRATAVNFPDLPRPTPGLDGGQFYLVELNRNSGAPLTMRMHVYLPLGEHADKSLPCVLVAPAGTSMMFGADVGTEPYLAETMPYVKAGMAVVFYSLAGDVQADRSNEEQMIAEIARAFPIFRAANGGVDNGRCALDFVLNKLPQVDPQNIFAAGHSSAATLALMFAASEPRLAGCVAYAPCTDPFASNFELLNDPMAERIVPGVGKFLQAYSPLRQVSRFEIPLFLFHARDDSVTPISESQKFVNQMRSQGKAVDLRIVNQGDHHQSMIDEGIPAGIAWIKSKLRK